MLPFPVSVPSKQRHNLTRANARRPFAILRRPTRLTNLGVLLLFSSLLLSSLINIRHWLANGRDHRHWGIPLSISATLNRPTQLQDYDHLVIVPGHGIWTGSREEDMLNETMWLLASYQRNRGRPAVLLEHIRRGSEIASQDNGALLVFSGGQTSQSMTTEAESYARLALTASTLRLPFHLTAHPVTLSMPPSTTETYALDSLQNFLFSIARFREFTGHYPTKITVVGYEFKRRRFEELHRKAVRWPAGAFEYVGMSLADVADEAQAAAGEMENSYRPFTADLYGCHPPLLSKRVDRNPHLRTHPYHLAAPELADLLEWCPSSKVDVFRGELPWDS